MRVTDGRALAGSRPIPEHLIAIAWLLHSLQSLACQLQC